MKPSVQNELKQPSFSERIINLQSAVDEDPTDLVAKLNLATTLQQEKHYYQAIEIYQEIIDEDEEGAFADTAKKAIHDIQVKYLADDLDDDLDTKEDDSSRFFKQFKQQSNIRQKFVDLPIGYKQFIALFTSTLLSVLGVVLAGRLITISLGRSQLENQAIAELAISEINYNSRLNEMTSGFRGQSDNTAIIDIARQYQNNKQISTELRNTVKQILKNEVALRQIEYATLVGLDSKIIVNANKDRFGEKFDPNGLVSEILKFPRPFQTNAIIPWSEIQAEQPPLPANIEGENVLVNLTFTPVTDPQTQEAIGLLIGGELVNGKTLSMRKTIEAVGGGYGAVYMFENGEFKPVTTVLQKPNSEDFETNVLLPDLRLLEKAELGTGGNIVERMKVNNQWHTLAVKDLPNYKGEEIAFIVRGTPETSLRSLLDRSLFYQILAGGLSLIPAILLAYLFGRALTKPIQN